MLLSQVIRLTRISLSGNLDLILHEGPVGHVGDNLYSKIISPLMRTFEVTSAILVPSSSSPILD